MKPYGVRAMDAGCCPGHDKYPHDSYGCTSRAERRRRLRPAKRRARQEARREARDWE